MKSFQSEDTTELSKLLLEIEKTSMNYGTSLLTDNINQKMQELITNQQLEIRALKEKVESFEEASKYINGIIFGCGGPLNDNCKGYTREQMMDFWNIKNRLGL
jgi:hypothetical protein